MELIGAIIYMLAVFILTTVSLIVISGGALITYFKLCDKFRGPGIIPAIGAFAWLAGTIGLFTYMLW